MIDRANIEKEGALARHLRAHGDPGLRLGGAARRRILAEIRPVEGRAAARAGFGQHRLPAVSLAAAAVAFTILSAGILLQSPDLQQLRGMTGPLVRGGSQAFTAAGSPGPAPQGMWADYQDGRVILTWKSQEAQRFALRSGARVPEARTARAVPIEGNSFVDRAVPEPKGAIFYVVE